MLSQVEKIVALPDWSYFDGLVHRQPSLQRVIVKLKNFFEILAENVMGNPDQYNSVQKDVWGNPAKNPEGQSLSEKEVAAELAKIGTDRAGVAAALESGLDAMASKARLLAAKNAAAVSGYDF